MGVGGFVLLARREADCRYVIERRRSPCEVLMSAETTASETSMFSARAIVASLLVVELESRGLKRNLEQREARGSIILRKTR